MVGERQSEAGTTIDHDWEQPMRIIELSNHPEQMLAAQRGQQAAERLQRQTQYEQAVAAHQQLLQRLQADRQRARRRRRPLTWLKATLALRTHHRHRPVPPLPAPAGEQHLEQQIVAGLHGEQLVANQLASTLDDHWTLIRGYRNRHGEIDQLLLGPTGLIAIEVKHRNATVHCNGDHWWYVKYDRYGNPVRRGGLQDRRGRSPSQQLNDPTDALEAFLASRRQQLEIDRVLIFNHPRARIGGIYRPIVHIETDARILLDLAAYVLGDLDARRLAAIERLIIRDHHFNAHHRPARQPLRAHR